jgi:hypothetical protein
MDVKKTVGILYMGERLRGKVKGLTLSYLLAVSPNLAFFRPGFLKKILR